MSTNHSARGEMAEESSILLASKRCAIVTGGNKGIGFEVCKQLASKGVIVVLTARDEKRGLDAVEKLKGLGLSDHVVFHQLDVADPISINKVAAFVESELGKLDILVNNAGVIGLMLDSKAFVKATELVGGWPHGPLIDWKELATQTYELGEECLEINYYGAKRMIEIFVPLLQQSDSARIVNVSSGAGRLEVIRNEWAKAMLSDVNELTVDKLDHVLRKFLRDFKEDTLDTNGWPVHFSAYRLSKVAINTYTRIVAKKYPNICVNCVCPGYVKTDMTVNTGKLTVQEGAENIARVALLPKGGPSGLFFVQKQVSSFEKYELP